MAELGTTGAKWDRYVEALCSGEDLTVERAEWKRHPLVRDHHESLAGGPLEPWVAARLPAGCRTALSIGAGTAAREIRLLSQGCFERLVVIDVSAHSLEQGRRSADELGVTDRVTFVEGGFAPDDLASIAQDAEGGLDAVLFFSSLHHMPEVHVVLAALRRHLSPRGVVIGDEYVGPDRFAFDLRARALSAAYYRRLDPALRCPWPDLPVPDPAAVALDDPSEAIDSSSILPALHATFDDVHVAALGGGLAFPLWFGLHHDALYEEEAGLQAVAELLEVDLRLTRSGVLPTYFCRFAAQVDGGGSSVAR